MPSTREHNMGFVIMEVMFHSFIYKNVEVKVTQGSCDSKYSQMYLV